MSSELCVPEWEAYTSSYAADEFPDSPDVEIRVVRGAIEPSPLLTTADEVRFHIREIGTYSIQAGRLIHITLLPNVGEHAARIALLGTAWAILCYQRDILVLHASVVEVHGQAVAFCGVSGAGKSSLAAWLVAHGYPLLGDDLCHFDLRPLLPIPSNDSFPKGSNIQPYVYPAITRLKLWSNALKNLGWEQTGLQRDHLRMDKFLVNTLPVQVRQELTPTRDALSPLPLRAIYLLAWGTPHIERLTGLSALSQLIKGATYRGELLEPMGAMAAHWQRCLALARGVPIYRFTRPADWSAMHLLISTWQRDAPSERV